MNEWLNHPALKNMDPVKLELIKLAAKQTEGKNGKSLAPVMMSLISSAHKKGITFSPEEMSFVLEILKDGKSKEEIRKFVADIVIGQRDYKHKERQELFKENMDYVNMTGKTAAENIYNKLKEL